MNLNNLVEDEVVDSLINSVKNKYENTSHRYYKLKAKWMGVEKLNLWDRNAPLPDADDSETNYNEAVDLVLSAYNEFSQLHDVAKKFLTMLGLMWGSKGKRSGAFAAPCTRRFTVFNVDYQGKTAI